MTDATGRMHRLRRRVLLRVLPSLGPRWLAVTDAPLDPQAANAPEVVVATSGVFTSETPLVRGALDRWPVASESATGVLVALAEGEHAARACGEAFRVLQPGGVAAFVAVWRADEVTAFDAALADAGLEPSRRYAVRRVGEEPSSLAALLPWLAARRIASASGAERIECVLVATRPGGFAQDLPTARSVLESMFVPQSLRRR